MPVGETLMAELACWSIEPLRACMPSSATLERTAPGACESCPKAGAWNRDPPHLPSTQREMPTSARYKPQGAALGVTVVPVTLFCPIPERYGFQISSSSRCGLSMHSLILTKKSTASRPSIRR
jgi:hypothetical protein